METNLNPKANVATKVLVPVTLGVIGLIVGSTLVHAVPLLNLRLRTDVIWFPLPLLVFSATFLWLISAQRPAEGERSHASRRWLAFATCVLSLGLIIFGLLLTGWDSVVSGAASLSGDAQHGSNVFRSWYSLVVPAAAGIVEEAALRGLIQLKLQSELGSAWSQALTGLIFVAMHGSEILHPRQLAFLGLLATASGMLTARSRSAYAAGALHSIVDFGISFVVLANRAN
jgi:membrane protease YdiL (CAAX protease family)